MPNARPDPQGDADFSALSSRLTAAFRDAIVQLAGADALAGGRFGVAVSGGPDSMALLYIAVLALGERVQAATVDHGLREGSAAEAEMVARWCAGRSIAHTTLRPATPITGSLQASARAARYALLEGWRTEAGVDWIMTAHHADDQAETLLMRLNRGSGVGGLAGVRARNGRVLRPLLGARKTELLALIDGADVPHALDPSNTDRRFDRVALRRRLESADWLDPLALARSAGALAQAQAAIEWTVRGFAAQHVVTHSDGTVVLDRHALPADLPREYARRLLLHMLGVADPDADAPRGDALDLALDRVSAGERAMIGDLLIDGGHKWTVHRAPPRRNGCRDG